MRILLSSVGRRGYLVKFFKESLGNNGEIWGGDNSQYAPAFAYCDKAVLLAKVTQADYADELLSFCKANNIEMVVPLIDPELEVLAAKREKFYDAGVMVVISPLESVEIAFDKYLTYKFGCDNDIAVPETAVTLEVGLELIEAGKLKWPVVVKPRKGSASANISYCHNTNQLENAFTDCPGPMIQECLEGNEYGYDLFSDRQFRPINVYCKRKLLMRAGETDKAVSVDDKELIDFGIKIATKLKIFGPVDVDVFMTQDGPKLLEINPRFGGGYPCSHLAGADYPAKLIAICSGTQLKPDLYTCPAGVYMLKQDEIISPAQEALDLYKNI